MSLITQLIRKEITWSQFEGQVESWGAKEFGLSPTAVQADVAAAKQDLKQVASTALGMADTALGPIISGVTLAVDAGVNTGLTAAGLAALTPAVDAAISNIANAGKAEIDAIAAAWRAKLTPPVTMAAVPNPTS